MPDAGIFDGLIGDVVKTLGGIGEAIINQAGDILSKSGGKICLKFAIEDYISCVSDIEGEVLLEGDA